MVAPVCQGPRARNPKKISAPISLVSGCDTGAGIYSEVMKITFQAEHETVNGQPHSNWTAIREDGSRAGFIEKEVDDVNFASALRGAQWKTVGYDVGLADRDDLDRFFRSDEHGGARGALTAAKKWIRDNA